MNRFAPLRIALVLATATAGLTACTAALGYGPEVTEVSVVVLSFDPRLPGVRQPSLREALDATPPRALADSLRTAVWDVSTRKVAYRIVDWRDIDALPASAGAAGQAVEEYRACLEGTGPCPDRPADVPALLDRYGVVPLIDRHIADEVWIFAGPHLGVEGAAMAGPGAVAIDTAYPAVPAARPFAVLGFSWAQGSGDLLYTFCRRVEAAIGARLGETPEGAAAWARFTATAAEADTAGVGTCASPPNAAEPFDYDNPDPVPSTAPAWSAFPQRSEATMPISATVWNGPDYRRSYLRWWFLHLPSTHRVPQPEPPANWWPLAFPGLDDDAGL